MLDRMIEVRETHIGHGVFALTSFPDEAQVGVVQGRLVDGDDGSSDYAIDVSDTQALEPDAPFRFLNHSCEPNCELIVWEEDGEYGDLCVFTIRDVEPGEELTIDYSWPAEHAIPCLCGTPSCRGWVVAESEVDEVELDEVDLDEVELDEA